MQHQNSFFVATVLVTVGNEPVFCCKAPGTFRVADGNDASGAQAFRALTTNCPVTSVKATLSPTNKEIYP